jgi:hypothetical protein
MSVSLESKRDSSRTSLWLVDAPLRAAAGATAPLDATARAIDAAAADGPGEAF